MKLKRFNESKLTNDYIYKTPKSDTYQSIKDIMYILSDIGCEIEYEQKNYDVLDIEIDPTSIFEFDTTFSNSEDLVRIMNDLIGDNSLYFFSKRLINVLRNLEEIQETDDIVWKIVGHPEIGDEFTIEVKLPSNKNAIINDCSGVIGFRDEEFYDLIYQFVRSQYKKEYKAPTEGIPWNQPIPKRISKDIQNLDLDCNSYQELDDSSGYEFDLTVNNLDVSNFEKFKSDLIEYIQSIFSEYLDSDVVLYSKNDDDEDYKWCSFTLNIFLTNGRKFPPF